MLLLRRQFFFLLLFHSSCGLALKWVEAVAAGGAFKLKCMTGHSVDTAPAAGRGLVGLVAADENRRYVVLKSNLAMR